MIRFNSVYKFGLLIIPQFNNRILVITLDLFAFYQLMLMKFTIFLKIFMNIVEKSVKIILIGNIYIGKVEVLYI